MYGSMISFSRFTVSMHFRLFTVLFEILNVSNNFFVIVQ